MPTKKKILVTPLNWGLGHASRCVPIIRELKAEQAEVIIASEGRASAFLKNIFPELTHIELKSVTISYFKNLHFVLSILIQFPKLIFAIWQDHKQLKQLIKIHSIDVVISDNRFGMWNKKIKSIFITHQLNIQAPFLQKFVNILNRYFINRYDECWIPDINSESNFSGKLSQAEKLKCNTFYIGLLSQFQQSNKIKIATIYDVCVIISGPEPQRTELEKIILNELIHSALKSIVICGKPELLSEVSVKNNCTYWNNLSGKELQKIIEESNLIICRSGYSSIMDLAILGKKAVFVPTPGQTEQIYLAERLKEMNIAFSIQQNYFSLTKALDESKKFKGFSTYIPDNTILNERLKSLHE